uniref:zinc finger protein OZF-like n=1 Tax=Doryrhamphus excisus TaxID=161450 RepID=UPI0025AEC15F|nr:zinc finger protein OZF-like [Doryrhamphus excisus]
MCKVQMLRALMEQRLNAAVEEIFGLFERTIAEYEEELSRTKEENARQQELLDAFLKPQDLLHRPDIQQVSVESQEEVPSEQQESELPHIKVEAEEQSSEPNRGSKPLTQHMTAGADGEHCKDIHSEPDSIFAPLSDMGDMLSDSSDTDESDNTQELLQSNKDSKGGMRHHSDYIDSSEIGKSRDKRGSLKRHVTVLTGEKPFACSFCAKPFYSKEHMKRHMMMHAGVNQFSCSVCGKRFTDQKHMILHMRTHTGEKPYACFICARRFSSNDYLKRHMMIHSVGNSFPCSICDKRFRHKYDMISHMKIHTDEKPFACSVCRKSFSSKYCMTTHMRTHAEDKQFTCSLCCKKFTSKHYVMIHMRTHTGEKPFSCNVCDKKFTYKYQVGKHKCATVMEAAGT